MGVYEEVAVGTESTKALHCHSPSFYGVGSHDLPFKPSLIRPVVKATLIPRTLYTPPP